MRTKLPALLFLAAFATSPLAAPHFCLVHGTAAPGYFGVSTSYPTAEIDGVSCTPNNTTVDETAYVAVGTLSYADTGPGEAESCAWTEDVDWVANVEVWTSLREPNSCASTYTWTAYVATESPDTPARIDGRTRCKVSRTQGSGVVLHAEFCTSDDCSAPCRLCGDSTWTEWSVASNPAGRAILRAFQRAQAAGNDVVAWCDLDGIVEVAVIR